MVTDRQVLKYREKLKHGFTREKAALAAGISVKTARRWEDGLLPSMNKKPRTWRTRYDPLTDVWDSKVVPLLKSDQEGDLQATTILDELKNEPGASVQDNQLRTLQRRIRDWRATEGPGKEVYFEQVHPPGREAQVDFTHAEELKVTIAGQPFPHLLFELILSRSGWRFVQICFGETFEALVKGTQDAFWDMGGLTQVLRSDNLSAATYQLLGEGKRKPTKRFMAVLNHLGLDYTRIQAGKSNENGVVEKGHDILKTMLNQALIVRASRDFATVEDYSTFVEEVRQRLCRNVATRFAEERLYLRPLPACRIPAYTDVQVCVRKWSTIRVSENTYSVSSNLIGYEVTARVHPDIVEVLYHGRIVESFPRLHGRGQHDINYHHVIHSLVRKPGAFARYRYREDLFPTMTFRRGYDALRKFRADRADVEYVRIIHLAATTMESEVDTALQLLLSTGKPFDYAEVKSLVDITPRSEMPHLIPFMPDLHTFDNLLTGGCHVRIENEARALVTN